MSTYSRSWYFRTKPQIKHINLRMPHETFAELREAAKRHKCSLNEMMNTFIVWGLEEEEEEEEEEDK